MQLCQFSPILGGGSISLQIPCLCLSKVISPLSRQWCRKCSLNCHFYLGAGSFPWPEKNWQCQSWNPQQNQFDTNLCLISFSLEARSWLMIKAPIFAPSPIFLLFIITIQMCYIPNKIRLRILRSNSSPSPLLSLSLSLSLSLCLSIFCRCRFVYPHSNAAQRAAPISINSN